MLSRRSNICFVLAAMMIVLAGCAPAGSPASSQVAKTEDASPLPPQNTTAPMPSATGAPVTTLLPLPTLATPLVEPVTPFVESTPTPPPFLVKVRATDPYALGTPVSYFLANADDLRAARDTYEKYFALITFRDAPPPPLEELKVKIAEVRDLDPDPALAGTFNNPSCSVDDVISVIRAAEQAGQYYRINAEPLKWSDDKTDLILWLGPSGASLQNRWSTNVLVQLVEQDTGRVIRAKTMALLGEVSWTFRDDRWIVTGEAGGFYCNRLRI